ncbi:TonB-dependent receptor [Flagellimonas allohymeniacidonis]|nr:Plug domain-containing protein [Allomuricauda hymeniacidonis]
MRFWIPVLCSLVLSGQRLWAQDESNFEKITGKLMSYAVKNYPEKVYVHTDKDYYQSGETLWFKLYLLNGVTHARSNLSKVAYVELLDESNKMLAKRTISMDSLGGFGSIPLDKFWDEGNYYIRAYTKYMLNDANPNAFQKKIFVWRKEFGNKGAKTTVTSSNGSQKTEVLASNPTEDQGIQFHCFPEGGNLVQESNNLVGFQIQDQNGKGVRSKGKVINQENAEVANFESDEYGLGTFQLRPEPGMQYFAVVSKDKSANKVKLPIAVRAKERIQIENNGDHLIIQVQTPYKTATERTFLLGHVRGNIFLRHESEPDSIQYSLKLLVDRLSPGVGHFTLFNTNGEVLAERMTFIHNTKKSARVWIIKAKDTFEKRGKVALRLRLANLGKSMLKGNISLSVHKLLGSGDNQHAKTTSIKKWLLLDSDIGPTVDNGAYFFDTPNFKNNNALEALLLGKSWGRFEWDELLKNEVSKKAKNSPEQGIMIAGRTTNFINRNVPKRSKITLGILEGSTYYETKNTDSQGNFMFGPLAFDDTVDVVLDAMDPLARKKEQAKNLAINIDSLPFLPLIQGLALEKSNRHDISATPYVSEAAKDYRRESLEFDLPPDIIRLEETVVKDKRKVKSNRQIVEEGLNEITPYPRPTHRLLLDSTNVTDGMRLLDIMSMIPGVRVRGTYPNQSIRLTRAVFNSINLSTSPLFVIDGVPLPPYDTSTGGSLDLLSMDTVHIMFIDVLTGAQASYYGARGSNGVIAIYTDRGRRFDFEEKVYPGILNLTVKGFDKPDRFTAPNYNFPKPQHAKPDYRNTLHWEPNLEISPEKGALITFFADDSSGKYKVVLEGVLEDGQLLQEEATFFVE